MHIAYLIPTIDQIGGAERQLIQLAIGIARRGCRVTVIAIRGTGGNVAQDLSATDVSFLSLEMRHGLADPRGWNRLRRWLNSAQPQVIHAHLAQATLMARGIRLVAPVRALVDTIHSPATGSTARRLCYRLTSRMPDVVTAVSRTCAQPWLDAHLLHPSELSIIPNGIDTDHWKPDPDRDRRERASDITSRDFRWIAAGRLSSVKDYATLLQAFSMLPQFTRLTIAGSGPLEQELRLQATKLGVQDRVRFLGFQNDVRRLMQNSDGYVLSSRWEGLPIALMEASACELPAVFTETSGARDLLPHSAFPTVPIGDPAALATAMKSLMELPHHKRRQLGRDARQHVVSCFNQDSILTSFESLYRQLLEANPLPARQRLATNRVGANGAPEWDRCGDDDWKHQADGINFQD